MFGSFVLHERLHKALEALSFQQPTDVQQATMTPALEGQDLYVIARTGSGKTAAYLLPLLQRLLLDERRVLAPRVLILAPTRELAAQIVADATALARFTFLRSELVCGGEDFKVQAARLRKNPDLIVATPGRAVEQLTAGNLDLSEVMALVYDEADRMLDMGFSEDVEKLAAACPPGRQTLMFSATSGHAGLQRVARALMREPQWLALSDVREDTPQIRQQVIAADDRGHKERLLKWLLEHDCQGKAMVFTNTREAAERLGGVLRAAGLRAYTLHGERDQKERKAVMAHFRDGGKAVLVATDVAARGLDIEAVDMVVNFDMPRSGDDYLHRVGRTGRAGAEGLAVSLLLSTEWGLMSSIERYLRRQFERRLIKELAGNFTGPKKLKASGKPVGSKKKKKDKDGKPAARSKSPKPAKAGKPRPSRPKVPAGEVITSSDGLAPPKRRRSPPAAE